METIIEEERVDFAAVANVEHKLEDVAARPIAKALYNSGLVIASMAQEERTREKAVLKFKAAAGLGLTRAQFKYGTCLMDGYGVPKDPVAAFVCFETVAKKGFAKAQYNLGVAYLTGEYVEQDAARAAFWFEKASQQGLHEASYNLGVLLMKGRCVAQDFGAAIRLFSLAAQHGVAEAQHNLAVLKLKIVGDSCQKEPYAEAIWTAQLTKSACHVAPVALIRSL